MTAVIYTKNNCSFCEKAKSLLTELNLEYVEKDVSNTETKLELLMRVPDARTVPQIFINEVYIGGYTELLDYTV
jgi:glutaredoxin 3